MLSRCIGVSTKYWKYLVRLTTLCEWCLTIDLEELLFLGAATILLFETVKAEQTGAACSTEPSEKSQALVPYAEESQLAINHAADAGARQDDAQAWQGNVSAEYCSFEQLAAVLVLLVVPELHCIMPVRWQCALDTARKLLLDQRAELREPVAKSLTDALTVAGALGSLPGPSEADQLAWAFRRAFDEQLVLLPVSAEHCM
eukprot:s2410_g5.t1